MINPFKGEAKNEHETQSRFFVWCAVATAYGLDAANDERSYTEKQWASKTYDKKNGVSDLKWIHAIPNGGSRGSSERGRKIRGAYMVSEGVKSGVSDVFLPVPKCGYHGMYIEFKSASGRLSEKQKEFLVYAKSNGYSVVLCYDWKKAVYCVCQYLNENVL